MLEDVLSRALAQSGMALEQFSLPRLGRVLIAMSVVGVMGSAAVSFVPDLALPQMPALPAIAWGEEAPDPSVPVVVLAPAPPPIAATPAAVQSPQAATPVSATPPAAALVRGPTPALRPSRAPVSTAQNPSPAEPRREEAAPVTFTSASAPAPAVIAALAEPSATQESARSGTTVSGQSSDRPLSAAPQSSHEAPPPRKRTVRKTGLSPTKAAKLFFRDIQRALNNF